MAITNGYITLAEFKNELNITSNTNDSWHEDIIEAASRLIDNHTGRRFYATTETRYYSPDQSYLLQVDDLLTVTTLKTDDSTRAYATTWETTDYDLHPLNAGADGRPYTEIGTTVNGDYVFPHYIKGVELAGSFGFCTLVNAPPDVKAACMMLSLRVFKRYDTPLGVTGGSVGTQAIRIPSVINDPDIVALLTPYRRLV
ncbi:MAG: hypothetical protein HN975_07635 [Anaerolineae bacterium]|jgi:hypothetical protein|nr:hypothetical protein [Anaerolineae bacterium]